MTEHIRELWQHYHALELATGGSGGEAFAKHLVEAERELVTAVDRLGGQCRIPPGFLLLTVERCYIGGTLRSEWITAAGQFHEHHRTCDVAARVNSLRTSITKWRRGPALLDDLAALRVD